MTRVGLMPIIFFVVLIFLVSSIPSIHAPGPGFLLKDKLAHFFEYFILGLLLFRSFRWDVSRSRIATFGFLLAIGATIGAVDEVYQSFIPGREMDINDWYADVLGVAFAVGLFAFTAFGKWPGTGQHTGTREAA